MPASLDPYSYPESSATPRVASIRIFFDDFLFLEFLNYIALISVRISFFTFYSYIKKETAVFFGVHEPTEENERARWLDRRKRLAYRTYGQLKNEYQIPSACSTLQKVIFVPIRNQTCLSEYLYVYPHIVLIALFFVLRILTAWCFTTDVVTTQR